VGELESSSSGNSPACNLPVTYNVECVATQHEIARNLRLSQATVSLGLRGDRSIPRVTRERIKREAQRIGYQPNSYVSSLMSHIRAGRLLKDKGCIAVLVDEDSIKSWYSLEPYKRYHQGMLRKAERLGFTTECFYLGSKGMSPERVEKILRARGIRGVVLAAPCRTYMASLIKVRWDSFAAVVTGYTWRERLDRVANDQYGNVLLAYEHLIGRGYKRIGFSLTMENTRAHGSRWLGGYAQAEQQYFGGQRLPIFLGDPGPASLAMFDGWLQKNQPDALITLTGHELDWLHALNLSVPGDLGLVTVVRTHDSSCSGIEERNELIGALTIEQVATRVMHNEYGLPVQPCLTLVEGEWVEGKTLRPVVGSKPMGKSLG
jgi:LacI family transcriptional regulator